MKDQIFPIILFALSMCITPGPNNIMLTASGIQFGFRRTLPHILGIALGLALYFVMASAGLGTLFSIFPDLKVVLKIGGVLYLIIYALKISFAKRSDKTVTANNRPLRIYEGLFFQFLNSKALVIIVSGVAAYTASGEEYFPSVALLVIIFFCVCIPSVSVWALFGSILRKFISHDKTFRIVNVVMGVMILLSIALIIH